MNYRCRARCFHGRNRKMTWSRYSWIPTWICCEDIDPVGFGGCILDPETSNKQLGTRRLVTFRYSTEHLVHGTAATPASREMVPFPRLFLLHIIPSLIATCLPNSYWWKSQMCSPETLYVEPTWVRWVLAKMRWCLGDRTREFSNFRLIVQWKLAEQLHRCPASSFIPKV